MKIAPFEMERYQSRYWHQVEHDLSESGVLPMTIRELLGPTADAEGFLHTALGYPLSEGSLETRASIAAWYPGASPEQVSITNGGSEANFLTLFSLLGSGDRLAWAPMDPPLYETFAFIQRRNTRLSPATRALMTLAEEHLAVLT